MTVLAASGRVWQRNWLVYKRLWHRSLAFGFLQPVLFLTAMGIGIGALLTPESLEAFGGVQYIDWLGPGLLAAMAMQTATFESTYPIMNKIMWGRNYEAILSTPVSIRSILGGELAWTAFRIGSLASVFLVVLAIFGIVRTPMAILAIPFATLVGVAFAACLIAFTATQKNDVGFSAIFRFVINPLFLFSGTFFPLTNLPEPLRAVAWATPLFHGVELIRGSLSIAFERIWRARRLVQRNIMVYRHQWIIILSGVFEPIFYLLGIGLGLGGIIEEVPLPNGQVVAYAAYVAPALVATAAMNGAVFETIFNVFFKLNYAKTYDGVLATPMGITEIAIGEMLWALMRAALYAVAMFVIMVAMGLILSPLGILMVPAALLVAAAFAAAGLAGTSYLRTVNDFDVPMGLIVMPMFLFSGTFFPIESVLPDWLVTVIQLTPLYHGISLIRGLSTGIVGIGQVWDLLYLVVFFAICMWIAMRQMERKLIK